MKWNGDPCPLITTLHIMVFTPPYLMCKTGFWSLVSAHNEMKIVLMNNFISITIDHHEYDWWFEGPILLAPDWPGDDLSCKFPAPGTTPLNSSQFQVKHNTQVLPQEIFVYANLNKTDHFLLVLVCPCEHDEEWSSDGGWCQRTVNNGDLRVGCHNFWCF